jgi:hypothetical protein
MSEIRFRSIVIRQEATDPVEKGRLEFDWKDQSCLARYVRDKSGVVRWEALLCSSGPRPLQPGDSAAPQPAARLTKLVETALPGALQEYQQRLESLRKDPKTHIRRGKNLKALRSGNRALFFQKDRTCVTLADSRNETARGGDGVPDYLSWKEGGRAVLTIEVPPPHSHPFLRGLKGYFPTTH